jgi:hypothetical protein
MHFTKKTSTMIEILPSLKENIIALKISGTLTKEDYLSIVPIMEAKIKQFGKIRFYGQIENLKMPTLSALWEDIKFDAKHYHDFSHVAVVGEPEWMAALTKLTAPIIPAEVRVFGREETGAAMEWLAR